MPYDSCQHELSIFIEQVNTHIFSWELTEIIEVTYIYKKVGKFEYFNLTLFHEFAGYKWSKKIDFLEVFTKTQFKLKEKISEISYYMKRCKKIAEGVKTDQGYRMRLNILLGTLKYVQNTLYMALYGLPFELEKAWYKHKLSKADIQTRVKNIEAREKENFGGKVFHNKKEVILCYEALQERRIRLRGKTKKAQELEYFIKKIEAYLPKNYTYKPQKPIWEKDIGKVFHTKIPREDYVKIFNLIFEIYKLPQRAKVTSASSIYDGEEFLEIPERSLYKEKSLKSILQLMLHEIMAHTVNLENTKRRLGEFRGANNLEKEEGLAVLLEKLFQGYTLDEIRIMPSLPVLLLGEICSTKDFKRYISLNYKNMYPTFLRYKRNYPKWKKWVQHKDTSYSRGILKAQKYLQKGGDIKDLFIGKVSFEDIPLLKKIPLLDENKEQVVPLLIAEVIYFTVKHSGKFHIHQDAFLKHLAKKYNFLDIDSLGISYSSPHVKKRLCKILEILGKHIKSIDPNKCDIVFK